METTKKPPAEPAQGTMTVGSGLAGVYLHVPGMTVAEMALPAKTVSQSWEHFPESMGRVTATAEKIARAWNAHDDMIDLLREALSFCDDEDFSAFERDDLASKIEALLERIEKEG